jgi:hypothetical protein
VPLELLDQLDLQVLLVLQVYQGFLVPQVLLVLQAQRDQLVQLDKQVQQVLPVQWVQQVLLALLV